MEPPFLSEAVVLHIHQDQLKRFGGQDGIRDENSLKSAVAMPKAGFGGQFFHNHPHGMAAAYAFHIAENQPFIDGNKRTALAAALTFLEACGVLIEDPTAALFDAMIALGNRQLSKDGLEQLFKKMAKQENPT
jgi:death-on-curing protein